MSWDEQSIILWDIQHENKGIYHADQPFLPVSISSAGLLLFGQDGPFTLELWQGNHVISFPATLPINRRSEIVLSSNWD
jgi:hypothetical protein